MAPLLDPWNGLPRDRRTPPCPKDSFIGKDSFTGSPPWPDELALASRDARAGSNPCPGRIGIRPAHAGCSEQGRSDSVQQEAGSALQAEAIPRPDRNFG
ncbi:MAG: hypothetical protein C6P37_08185 [Caldibacillus debilis]|uniref:Uncharacterized protein n=1 Tax=Caldibacillus debilis TaxID=301148 RepID=A0A3E0K589_9BACI|nr:hypothetical protein [Bacillaceae bacterium]MBY6273587.1 hypothetical protein [Bacillaceae bacterium]REJ28608.1 MAG: hypothetical protein C6P37_08185 [Caldibacillus debilis]REJ29900.1 MAG: hypothetical protein C6W56_04660 [Caldibacillus debilis]